MFTEKDLEVKPVKPTRVLLAADDDDDSSSKKAFYYACTIARDNNLPLAVASVLETGDMSIFQSLSPDVVNGRRDEIAQNLDTYIEKAKAFGVQDCVKIISEGNPRDELLDTIIPSFNPDLIVVGSHNDHVGHVAVAIVKHAKAPVIVVR